MVRSPNGKIGPKNETERHIKPNNPEFNNNFNYAKNYIKTSKYTLLSFVPYNLFEQFQRLANFYFLCLLILQLIPVISSLSWVTTAVPLIGVLSVTAAKDAYDDYQRHRSDRQVNGRKSQVLRNGEIKEEVWSKVSVGDIIRMEDDQFIAADVLILSTSEPNGLCYIETSELDGETNLKSRQCLPETADLKDDPTAICRFDGEIVCEAPNNQLNKFEGTLYWRQSKFALDNDKILLRGCILRNTDWCYGIVIFAGKDTKLMQNSGKTKFKRTSIDRLLNFIILGIVFFLLSMCLFCTVACGIWETLTGRYFTMYLPWDDLVPSDPAGGAAVIALLIFFSYAIVLNTVVPISLYVSVEVIRLAQSFLINWDNEMSYETQKPNSDIRIRTNAKARTTTLNEELGQIQYIFSDKTGTLTQNIMSFNKCSISGRSYGDVLDPRTGESMEMTEETPVVDLSSNPYYEPSFKFYDPTLVETLKANDPECVTFFKLLALCHTVMPEVKKGKLEYQAQSPDEGALVSAARNFGFVFLSRTPSSITISVKGEEETHELLCILDFNNVRKRMSVILRRSGKIRLYCKGADSIVFERIKSNQEALKRHTEDHLNKFAGEGLRTLLLAVKDLEEEYFQDWKQRHHAAATSMDNRELKLHNIYEEIEKDLIIIGATAIEDKLQDRVPQTIANLGIAGIKIWVLTGDKQETAINIGYSCQLLTDEMAEVFIVDGHSCIEVVKQLGEIKELMKNFATKGVGNDVINVVFSDGTAKEDNISDAGENSSEFAVVVSGHSLIWALNPTYEELFLEIASQCKSVICCRVTPLQKALVVDLVKRHKKAVTLAIGDGANDVSMIKTAHIGVGISGQEGLQAVLASDYSIAQFRFLERLLLVHGRWSYFRMCKFLRYFFYKNFAFTLCHFWFAFFVGFSAQTVYDPFFISTYNLFYTSLPVLFIGTVDQDVDDFNCRRFPKLYTQGHLNMDFNKKAFVLSAFHGLITSAIIMFIPYVYNLFYTSMPVLALGIFEQDVNAANSHKYPRLYTSGLQSSQFNKMSFLRSSLHGFLTAFVLFFLPFGAYYNGMDQNGREMADHQTFGSLVSTILVIVVTMQISLDTSYWTIFSHVTIWGSLVFYFLLQYFYNFVIGGSYVGSLAKAMSEPVFYFTSLLTIVVLMLPVMAWRFYWVDTHPTLTDKVRYKQRMELKLASKRVERKMARTPSARRSRRSIRSGYAFDHQEGFGRLITSGKIMHPRNLKSNFFSESSRHNGPPRHNEASTIMVQPFSSPTNVEV